LLLLKPQSIMHELNKSQLLIQLKTIKLAELKEEDMPMV